MGRREGLKLAPFTQNSWNAAVSKVRSGDASNRASELRLNRVETRISSRNVLHKGFAEFAEKAVDNILSYMEIKPTRAVNPEAVAKRSQAH